MAAPTPLGGDIFSCLQNKSGLVNFRALGVSGLVVMGLRRNLVHDERERTSSIDLDEVNVAVL